MLAGGVSANLHAQTGNGALKVTSFPSGAKVSIDDVDTGKMTPASFSLTVGDHNVVVSIPSSGWNPDVRRVTIVSGNNDLSVTLLPTAIAGQQGPQGPQGPPGPQGPVGPMPVGAALTTTSNTFRSSQIINGNLILGGSGGIQFPDGTVQTTAMINSGGEGGLLISSTSPIAPAGYTPFSHTTGGNVWLPMAPMPTARLGLTAAAVSGKIYAIGGNDNSSAALSTTEVYDPSSNTWNTVAPMSTARTGLAAVTVNGKIYAIGGRPDYNASTVSFNAVEVYDPATNTWSSAAPMPTARGALAAAAVNGRIYAIGGFAYSNNLFQPLDTVEVYDPSSDTWSTAAPMPTRKYDLAAVGMNGKLYVIGGSALSSTSPTGVAVLRTVEVYDPSTNTWSTASHPMPTPRAQLAAVALNGNAYAIGGFDSSPVNAVEVYHASVDSWTGGTGLAGNRFGLAAAEVNGMIYALGGTIGLSIGMDRVEQYQPQTFTIYTFIKN